MIQIKNIVKIAKLIFQTKCTMNNLKKIREIYGATQEHVANALGVNRVTIANWENNKLVGKKGATINDELGLSGHYVEWAYPWDTNSISSKNVNVTVITEDASANKNADKEYSSSDNICSYTELAYLYIFLCSFSFFICSL